MTQHVIFVNPSHGNEPYILGTQIAKALGERLKKKGHEITIILPYIYTKGERQLRILEKEVGLDANCILDKKLGSFYHELLFQGNDFKKYLEAICTKRADVERRVREHLTETYKPITIELNIGSRFTSGAPTYYAFPALLSELLHYALKESVLKELFTEELLHKTLTLVKEVDSRYKKIFIPSYHLFSWDKTRKLHPTEIPTPPLKPLVTPSKKNIPKGSVFCMISGTDSEVENILERARLLQKQGTHVLVAPLTLTEEFEKMSPLDAIPNPNLTKVITRAGWGTLWICQQAGVEVEVIPYTPNDDPEIFYNLKTLENIPLLEGTATQRELFGEENMDGIAFVANKIVEDLQLLIPLSSPSFDLKPT